MVANILFATTGVALYKHYCLLEDKQEISLAEFAMDCKLELKTEALHSCCKSDGDFENTVKEQNCCDYKIDYLALQIPLNSQDKIQLSNIADQGILLIHIPVNRISQTLTFSYQLNTIHKPEGRTISLLNQAFLT